jgi:hypothetical protein
MMLMQVNIEPMPPSERLPFWLNVFHTLLLHAHLHNGLTTTAFRSMSFFKTAYMVGKHKFALLGPSSVSLRISRFFFLVGFLNFCFCRD